MAILSSKDTNEEKDAQSFQFPTSSNALIIFTRNPELGKCKTRLAATIGDEKALHIYSFLVQHTAAVTAPVKADKFVYYSEELQKDDLWDAQIFRKKVQQGNDLGIRMQNAFTEVFKIGYQKAIIIGSDMYDITTKDLDNAFTALNNNHFVVGPAEDGGYYLLGMKHIKPSLFKEKLWGTATVLEDTLKDLKEETVYQLPLRNDVDIFEDIKDHPVFQTFL